MSAIATVIGAYKAAWSRRTLFVGVYLGLRLVSYAVLAPVVGLLLGYALSFSNQSALTDQDIAGFVLTPAGAVATVLVLSVLLIVEVLGFAFMAAVWRAGGGHSMRTVRTAALALVGRAGPLAVFALLFVLRVLLLVLSFGIPAALIAWSRLTEYDINYYLTHKPPEALVAGALIALLLILLAVSLLIRLSSWALALHMVIFERSTPRTAFADSEEAMRGRRWALVRQVLVWLAIRMALMVLLGVLAGLAIGVMPVPSGSGLRLILALIMTVTLVWGFGGIVVAALALAALARLVDDFAPGRAALTPAPRRAPSGMRRRLAVLGIGALALVIAGFWSGGQLLDRIRTEDRVYIIAHRGAAGSRPENTLASVRKAIEDGTDWVEIDVQETADGQVVVVHDSDFMKLAGSDLKVWDATMQDLAEIDIGGWFDPAYADQRTPLLRDVLEIARDKAHVLIELKFYGHAEDLENRVIAIVEETGMADQIATMSLKYPLVQSMLALRPDWRSGVLAATAVGDLAGLDGDFVAVSMGQATPRLADRLDTAGKDLYVWTVNDPLQMSKMISMGADGLITDEPALARQVLAIRAGLSTPERLLLWMSEELGLSVETGEYRDDSP